MFSGKDCSAIGDLSKKAKDAYHDMGDEAKENLKLQAEASSNCTVYYSKKRICKEGRKIMERMRKDVCHLYTVFVLYTM